MSQTNIRVGAIQSSNENEVYLFGYGVYVGDEIHPEMQFKNPKIVLDDGRTVWGVECWWGAEDKIKNLIGQRTVIPV